MDAAEEKEEEFIERVIIPRKEAFTYKNYCLLIKTHVSNKNLKLALNVLDIMKENAFQPNLYIYRLLLFGFSKQGDIKQCFKLFRIIKQRGLIPNLSVYTSLINVCAETNDSNVALKHLAWLREYFYVKQINLNNVHYATLIKAYSHHKQIVTAFQIADEAKDKGICSPDIVAALFHGIIGDTENGLKYALILWHTMKIKNIKPNIYHYNLLLRAIRDTKFGDLKINDILIPGSMNTQIQFNKSGRPDLLHSPPTITTSLISLIENNKYSTLNDSNLLSEVTVPLNLSLNDILKEHQLLLFGGIDKFLQHMQDDNVKPNTKTLTLLLNLLPPTKEAEDYFLRYIDKNKLEIDITFFNVLIKRRNMRKDYNAATELLNIIQNYHLIPNIITFGVLALGCTKCSDAKMLVEQMNNIGYEPNNIIIQTLLFKACYIRNFDYVIYLIQYMSQNKVKITKYILDILEKFDILALESIEKQV
ncbi:Pentatricopeptide repeat-containing protein 1 [Eufriesea mexicana]|nr:Pentatricopeptide repeat-containing protein 1 [Eufriesea mexicana]